MTDPSNTALSSPQVSPLVQISGASPLLDHDFRQDIGAPAAFVTGRGAMVYRRTAGPGWAQVAAPAPLLDMYDTGGTARGWYLPGAFRQAVGNSAMVGAAAGVVGAGGALPHGWISSGFAPGGFTLEVLEVGTDTQTQLPSIRLRWSGVNPGTATAYPAIFFTGLTAAAASAGEVWTGTVRVRGLGSTYSAYLYGNLRESKSNGAYAGNLLKRIDFSTSLAECVLTRSMAATDVAAVDWGLTAAVAPGASLAIDCIVIAPQLLRLPFAPDVLAIGLDSAGALAVGAEQARRTLQALKPLTVLCQFVAPPASQAATDTRLFCLKDDAGNALALRLATAPTQMLRVETVTAGGAHAASLSVGTASPGSSHCVALRYTGSTVAASLNGASVAVSAQMDDLAAFGSLDLNANTDSGAGFHYIERVAILPAAVDDAVLRAWSAAPPLGEIIDVDAAAEHVSAEAGAGAPVGITIRASNAAAYALDDDAGGAFAIDPRTGMITLAQPLDPAQAAYDVVVRATAADGASVARTFTITNGAHAQLSADEVRSTPGGELDAETVQAALDELDAEKAPRQHTHPGLVPPGGAAGQVLKKASGADHDTAWQDEAGAAAGETTTASNVNVAGVGVFKQKTGANLEMRGVASGSARVTVALAANGNEITLDVNEPHISLQNLGGSLRDGSAHGVQGGGALHAAATPSSAGFMTPTDKTKLDGIAPGAQVNTVTSVAGRTGAVKLGAADITAAATASLPAGTVQSALQALDTAKAPLAHQHAAADLPGRGAFYGRELGAGLKDDAGRIALDVAGLPAKPAAALADTVPVWDATAGAPRQVSVGALGLAGSTTGRAITAPQGDDPTINLELPPAVDRRDFLLGFSASGAITTTKVATAADMDALATQGIRVVPTMADLRKRPGRFADEVVWLRGYYKAGDGGEGMFRWDAANNNQQVSTIAVSSGGTGYAVGDIIRVTSGTPVNSVFAYGTVAAVSGGSVTSLTLRWPGRYTVNPTLTGSATAAMYGSAGSGLTVNLTMANHSDDGTIINPTGNAGPGRWLRMYSGPINVRWFPSESGQAAMIQNAVNAAGYSGEVYVPAGSYYVTATIFLHPTQTFRGAGRDATYLNGGSVDGPILLVDRRGVTGSYNGNVFRDFETRGRATNAIKLIGAIRSRLEDIVIQTIMTGDAVLVRDSFSTVIVGVTLTATAAGAAILFYSSYGGHGCNSVVVRDVYTSGSFEKGIVFHSEPSGPHAVGVTIDSCAIQSTSGPAVELNHVDGAAITGLYTESTGIPIKFGDYATGQYCRNISIISSTHQKFNAPLYIESGSNILFTGCNFWINAQNFVDPLIKYRFCYNINFVGCFPPNLAPRIVRTLGASPDHGMTIISGAWRHHGGAPLIPAMIVLQAVRRSGVGQPDHQHYCMSVDHTGQWVSQQWIPAEAS